MASVAALVQLVLLIAALWIVVYLSRIVFDLLPMAANTRTACRLLIVVCAVMAILFALLPGEPIF